MVLLVAKISKLYSKMENHHHPKPLSSSSLQAFQSDVLSCLNRLLLNLKPGSEVLSLLWIRQYFELLPIIHKAFAKLVVDIDYPMSKWEAASVEEFLSYSLKLLELLNSISSSLSHLGQARLPLFHALSLLENSPSLAIEHLKTIQPKGLSKDFKEAKKDSEEERVCSGKELVIHQALMLIKNIGFWVCGTVLSGLSGYTKPYKEMKNLPVRFVSSSLIGLDSSICDVIKENGSVLKEMREVNEAVACLVTAIAISKSSSEAEELQRRLEVFEKQLEGLGKEVDHLFSEVLAGRNELLNGCRLKKQ